MSTISLVIAAPSSMAVLTDGNGTAYDVDVLLLLLEVVVIDWNFNGMLRRFNSYESNENTESVLLPSSSSLSSLSPLPFFLVEASIPTDGFDAASNNVGL